MQTETIPVATDALLDRLQNDGVAITERASVRNYLCRYPDVAPPLLDASDATHRRFPQARLSVAVYNDAETEDTYLTLYARQEQYDEDIMHALNDIAAAYDEKLSRTSGWLLITTDFAPPC